MLDSIDYYSRNANIYYEHTKDLNMESVLDKFIEYLPEGSSVLDLGCGSGRDSLYLIEKGFDVTALDGAEELCELASIHIRQDVLHMKFDEIDFNNVFDGVWACASLVHVTPDKIDSILKKVIGSMKTDGILYMSFKYGDFAGIQNDRYFKHYKTRTLKEVLNQFDNLEVIDIWKTEEIREDREEEEWINTLVRKIY